MVGSVAVVADVGPDVAVNPTPVSLAPVAVRAVIACTPGPAQAGARCSPRAHDTSDADGDRGHQRRRQPSRPPGRLQMSSAATAHSTIGTALTRD
jgi:hypothetical protein